MPKKKKNVEQDEYVERCPECDSGHLTKDYDRGELVCEECGLVLDDQMIDQGPEWRAFDVEQTRIRTGRASRPGTGPSCTDSGSGREGSGYPTRPRGIWLLP
jgi:transcription initiation factor TFIIB